MNEGNISVLPLRDMVGPCHLWTETVTKVSLFKPIGTSVESVYSVSHESSPSATKLRRLCLSTGGCLPQCMLGYRPPPRRTRHPAGPGTPSRSRHLSPDGYCCGRYASYWNAFLFGWFFTANFYTVSCKNFWKSSASWIYLYHRIQS